MSLDHWYIHVPNYASLPPGMGENDGTHSPHLKAESATKTKHSATPAG